MDDDKEKIASELAGKMVAASTRAVRAIGAEHRLKNGPESEAVIAHACFLAAARIAATNVSATTLRAIADRMDRAAEEEKKAAEAPAVAPAVESAT